MGEILSLCNGASDTESREQELAQATRLRYIIALRRLRSPPPLENASHFEPKPVAIRPPRCCSPSLRLPTPSTSRGQRAP